MPIMSFTASVFHEQFIFSWEFKCTLVLLLFFSFFHELFLLQIQIYNDVFYLRIDCFGSWFLYNIIFYTRLYEKCLNPFWQNAFEQVIKQIYMQQYINPQNASLCKNSHQKRFPWKNPLEMVSVFLRLMLVAFMGRFVQGFFFFLVEGFSMGACFLHRIKT